MRDSRNYHTTDEDRAYAAELGEDPDAIGEMLMDGDVEASDGCVVEPDGICPHGRPSPLLVLGVI